MAVRRLVLSGLIVAALGGLIMLAGSWWRGRPARHLAAAEHALQRGDPNSALDWLALPERTPETREPAALLRARAALERGRPAEAMRPLDRIDPQGPLAIEAAFWKARTLLAAGESTLALAWFRGYLQARPDDLEAWRWMATAAYEIGSRDEAVRALRSLVTRRPGDAPAWRTLGLIHKENVEYEEADDAYRRSLAADSQQPRVRFEWAEVLVELGRFDEAEAELARCLGAVPEADRATLLARCRAARGDLNGQRTILDAALADAPEHPGLLGQRAALDMAEGQPQRALERLDRAIAVDPFHPQRIYQRGLAHRAVGNAEAAARDLERAAELNRDLARMSELNQQAAGAPTNPEVRYEIGQLCERLGQRDLARTWYRAAIACDPRHAGARQALSELNRRPRPVPTPLGDTASSRDGRGTGR
jgi:tetratricopeptide (TPR) repeat protein